MSKIESSAGKALYEQQETKLSQQSAAFIELLTKRGILGDSSMTGASRPKTTMCSAEKA